MNDGDCENYEAISYSKIAVWVIVKGAYFRFSVFVWIGCDMTHGLERVSTI